MHGFMQSSICAHVGFVSDVHKLLGGVCICNFTCTGVTVLRVCLLMGVNTSLLNILRIVLEIASHS